MKIKFVRSSEKKKITQSLSLQFGITNLPYLLIKSGKEKFRAYSGHLSKEEISQLASITNIESIGLYLIKQEHDLRLTIDATHLLKDQITKNIFELNNQQFKSWILGHNLSFDDEIKKGTFIIKNNSDFIGCGKSNSKVLFNYVPKSRRLKK